ncbi:MAG: DEAD/DEAH box helicase [Gemmatimonadetes bacterium]|nr:DEAD/DEAH box helicase [Gemmatimonadota bacterium]
MASRGDVKLPELIDDRTIPGFRAVYGHLTTNSHLLEVAVRSIHLSSIDLRRSELAKLRTLRLLMGRVDTGSLAADAQAVAADPHRRANLMLLLSLLDAGIVEVRAAALLGWAPDFSVFHDARGPRRVLVGLHSFGKPSVPGSVWLTSLHEGGAAVRAAARFSELWADGRDVSPAILEILERAATSPRAVRETARRPYGSVTAPAQAAMAALQQAFGRGTNTGEATDGSPDLPGGTSEGEDGKLGGLARPGAPQGLRELEEPGLTVYQADAAERAEQILSRRRGVLICDSVGLGKTFIALRLIEHVLRRGGRAVVVSPAALRTQWTKPLLELAERCGVGRRIGLGRKRTTASERHWQSGRLELAEATATYTRPLVAWLSQARLSRGTHGAEMIGVVDLVVVDEAHNFRNPGTRRYAALADLTAGARVALLTATPVNNSAWDLYWLIRTFAGDADFADLGVPSLKAATDAAHRTGASLRPVVAALTVRRSRAFIRDHYQRRSAPGSPDLRFPSRAPPVPIRYSLDEHRPGWSREALKLLEELEFAALEIVARAARRGGSRAGSSARRRALAARRPVGAKPGAPAEIMRLALLKRLESSVIAFARSIGRQLRLSAAVRDGVVAGRVPDAAEIRAIVGGDDAAQLLMPHVIGVPLPRGLELEPLVQALERDLGRLGRLQTLTGSVDASMDPKLARLADLLTNDISGEKVAVFTEFRDTARYLHQALCGRARVALVDGGCARLGAAAASRAEVIARFAPRANGARPPGSAHRVDVLVATDVLSEGLNLQDAGRIVSYDLPWNPVRLIQRIGRIDRLGSCHELVHVYNFIPDVGLDAMLRLFARIRSKLATIGETVGTDGVVFGDERPWELDTALSALAAGDASYLDEIERAEATPFEIEERIRLRWRKAAADAARAARGRPSGPPDGSETPIVAAATDNGLGGLTALCFRADAPRGAADADGDDRWVDDRWVVSDADGLRLDRTRALQTFARALEASPAPVDHERLERDIQRASDCIGTSGAAMAPDARSAESRARRRLDLELNALRGEPDPALCERIDRLAPALARPLPVGLSARVNRVLAQGLDARRLLHALEGLLARHQPVEQDGSKQWRLVAAVQLVSRTK